MLTGVISVTAVLVRRRDIIALLEDPLVYRLPPKSERQDLKDFFSGGFKVLSRELTRPRIIKMTHLRDWVRELQRACSEVCGTVCVRACSEVCGTVHNVYGDAARPALMC